MQVTRFTETSPAKSRHSQAYDAIIREQLYKGIVENVAEPDIGKVGKVHYIPHHPVTKLDKATTKLRVVDVASAS